MGKVRRIHIEEDDARKLEDRFWTLDTNRVDFKTVFQRVNAVLDVLLTESPDVLEKFTREWAIDDANSAHEQEKP